MWTKPKLYSNGIMHAYNECEHYVLLCSTTIFFVALSVVLFCYFVIVAWIVRKWLRRWNKRAPPNHPAIRDWFCHTLFIHVPDVWPSRAGTVTETGGTTVFAVEIKREMRWQLWGPPHCGCRRPLRFNDRAFFTVYFHLLIVRCRNFHWFGWHHIGGWLGIDRFVTQKSKWMQKLNHLVRRICYDMI